jgi:hypothetical protein
VRGRIVYDGTRRSEAAGVRGGLMTALPTSHPYSELPQPNEMRTARVRKVTDNPRVEHAPDARAEPGMFVLVPQHWPGECDLVLTGSGYYAEFRQGPLFHQFHVWPVRRRELAEAAYEEVRRARQLDPSVIARTTRLPDPAADIGRVDAVCLHHDTRL